MDIDGSTLVHTYILIDIHVPGPGAFGAFGALGGLGRAFFASTGSFATTKKKFDELRARFSRFAARTWPPKLDFGSPGRSRARFRRPKRLDFRGFSSLPRVRCKLPQKCTKLWQELHFSHIGASARRHENSEKSFCGVVRQCSMLRMHSDIAPGRSGSVLGPSRARFWTALGRSWPARGVPRSALERFLVVQEPSRTRLETSLTRP